MEDLVTAGLLLLALPEVAASECIAAKLLKMAMLDLVVRPWQKLGERLPGRA